MGAAPSRSTRLRATAGMMLLVIVLGGTWAGLAQAEPATPHERAVPPTTPPTPHIGDAGVYRIDTPPMGRPLDLRFHWLPDGETYGAYQGHHRTNQIEVWWPHDLMRDPTSGNHTGPSLAHVVYDRDQATKETVAVRAAYQDRYTAEEMLVDTPRSWAFTDIRLQEDGDALPLPCVLALQSPRPDLLRMPPCGGAQTTERSDILLHYVHGLQVVDATYTVYQATSAAGQIEALLRSDLPYPVRLTITDRDGAPTETWSLIEFTRGARPIGETKSDRSPLADVSWRPWTRDGPDVSGIPLDLPLETAIDIAKSHPDSRLPHFLAAHPDAYLYHGAYDTVATEYEKVNRWTLAYGVGRDRLALCVEERLVLAMAGAPTEVAARHHVEPCSTGGTGVPPPTPPVLAPTAASVAAWYETYRTLMPALAPANALTFNTKCLDRDCVARDTQVAVGHRFHFTREDRVGLPEEGRFAPSTYHVSALVVDGTGSPERLIHILQEDVTDETPPGGHVAPPPRHLAAVGPTPALPDIPMLTPAETATVGLVTLLIGLFTWFLPTFKNLFMAPLFTRIQRPKILDHEMRARIRSLIDQEPGIHGRELARRLGLARGSLMHHVRMMEQAHAIRVVRTRGYATYFPPFMEADAPDGLAHVRSETAQDILLHIGRRPDASASEIARLLGLTPQGVLHHVSRLVESGLVLRDAHRRPAPLRLTESGETVRSRLEGATGPRDHPDRT